MEEMTVGDWTDVPARVGGVDLSISCVVFGKTAEGPRPCGRGGFKRLVEFIQPILLESPPVWAGWI